METGDEFGPDFRDTNGPVVLPGCLLIALLVEQWFVLTLAGDSAPNVLMHVAIWSGLIGGLTFVGGLATVTRRGKAIASTMLVTNLMMLAVIDGIATHSFWMWLI